MQEYVEAFTYYEYINSGKVLDWNDLQEKMSYDESNVVTDEKETDNEDKSVQGKTETKKFKCLVQPIEFMLGLADSTGEVMRRCITSLGCGDVKTCFQVCSFLQSLYTG